MKPQAKFTTGSTMRHVTVMTLTSALGLSFMFLVDFLALFWVSRLKIEGFIVSEHMEVWPEALTELGTLVATGKLRPRESVAEGIAAAPEAFLGLLKGKNFGKQVVKLV